MKILFWIVLKLRLKQRFWADLFLKWHRKEIAKLVEKIDLDPGEIRFEKINDKEV